jgi:hypothetical protein
VLEFPTDLWLASPSGRKERAPLGGLGESPSPAPAMHFTTQQQTCKTPASWLALAHRFGAVLRVDTLGHRPPSPTPRTASTAQRSPLQFQTEVATRITTLVGATCIVSSLQEGCPIPALTSWRCALRAEQRSQYERPSSAPLWGASAISFKAQPQPRRRGGRDSYPQSLVQGQFAVPAHW